MKWVVVIVLCLFGVGLTLDAADAFGRRGRGGRRSRRQRVSTSQMVMGCTGSSNNARSPQAQSIRSRPNVEKLQAPKTLEMLSFPKACRRTQVEYLVSMPKHIRATPAY